MFGITRSPLSLCLPYTLQTFHLPLPLTALSVNNAYNCILKASKSTLCLLFKQRKREGGDVERGCILVQS